MFQNYLKTAYRNLLRHKGASLIKLAGLSIGMCCCLLILLYLWDELSYNTFNIHYKNIYRVNYIKSDGSRKGAGTPNAAGPAIVQDIPSVAAVARLYNRSGILATQPGEGWEVAGTCGVTMAGTVKRFQEPGVDFADNAIFDIFTTHWKEGTAKEALS